MRSRLLIFFLILGCSNFSPQNNRSPASERNCKTVIRNFLKESVTVEAVSTVTKKQQKKLVQVIGDVDSFMEGFLISPPHFFLKIHRHFENAFWSPIDLKIETPFQFITKVKSSSGKIYTKLKHPRYTLYILAHEYGHAYFGFNFVRNLGERPLTVELRSVVERLTKTINEMTIVINSLRESKFYKDEDINDLVKIVTEQEQIYQKKLQKLLQSHTGSRTEDHSHSADEFDENFAELTEAREGMFKKVIDRLMDKSDSGRSAYEAKKKEVRKKIEELSARYKKEEEKLEGLSGSPFRELNELFADCVAYFYSKDPDAVRDALHYSGTSEKSRISSEMRGFEESTMTTRKELKRRYPKYKVDDLPTVATSDYETINLVRNYLYDHYLSVPKYRDNPGRTLKTILLSMEDFARIHIVDKSGYDYRKINDVNGHLKFFIDKRFEKF